MTRPHWVLLASLATLAACGGTQDLAATPAADSTAVAPAPAIADSASPSATDSGATATADSAKGAVAPAAKPAAPKVETGDYDKTMRPRFKIDEKTGKIDTIRKP